MITFYKPKQAVPGYSPDTVFDEQGNALSHDQYIAAGGATDYSNVVPGNAPGTSAPNVPPPSSNYAPLPPVGGAGSNSGAGAAAPPSAPTQSPVDKFNAALMNLLGQAQQTDTSPLSNQANKLGVEQLDNSQQPAAQMGIGDLKPSDALNARQNAAQLYNPEINSLEDRVKASATAVSNFKDAIDAAKSFGEDYAKTLKPDDATIAAVKQQMAAGFLPDATVLDKVGSSLTADDWNALAAAKKAQSGSTPTSIEEYNLAKSQGFTGTFQQWTDRPSQYKGSSGGSSSAQDDKEFTEVKAIVAAHPNEWGHAADAIDAKFGAGTATKYDDYLKSVYGFAA